MSLKSIWRRRPFSVVLVIVVLVVAGRTYQTAQQDARETAQEAAVKSPLRDFPRDWSKRVLETDEGTIVEYRMNNVVFRFPKAIVVQDREGLGAVVLPKWPTMERARTIADPDMIDVSIWFRQIRPSRDYLAQLARRYPNKQFVEAPGVSGLLVFASPLSGGRGDHYLGTEPELVDSNGDPLMLVCGAGIYVPYRRCTVWFQVMPGVEMKYRFYDKHLADWREIHRALMDYIRIDEE